MVLYAYLDNDYYVEHDPSVQEMMNHTYASAIQINQSFWSEADIDTRFRAGDQTLWNDIYGNLPAFRRRQFNFNKIRRICNMITGYQRQHRHSTVVIPVENSDEVTSDQLSKTLIWANRNSDAYETISQAFDGAVTTGMNLLAVWMDYREDPINGDIRVDNVSYNSYLIDPFFRKHDLSDCRYLWSRKWMDKKTVKSILPEKAQEIDGMQARGWRDGKFQFQPEAYNYAMEDLLTYDEYWYMDYRKRKLLVDIETGMTLEWKGDDDNLKKYLSYYPQITVVEQEIPSVKLAISVQGKTMYHGPNPMGIDRYPFVPVIGYYDPQIPYFPWRIQGVVRGLRDAQYLYNRRKIIELDILESQINSGIKFKENALVNPKDAFLQGQGRALALKQNASMEDVQQIPPPQVPPSMIQLSEILGREIMEISGVNEELLGSAEDDSAGILSMLRQGAGLTTLQILFDQLDYSQKLLGKIYLDLIQANFSPGKIQRIINEQPSEQFYTRSFQKYDCVIEEGLNTSTQRQMQFKQLLALRQMGIPVPTTVLIDNSTIQNKKELTDAIAQEEQQAQQMAMQQQQVAQEVQQAQMQSLQSKAFADQGLGAERIARIEENRALAVERLAESEKDRSLSTYHELKSIKELQDIDLEQFIKFLNIVKLLKNIDAEDEAANAVSESIENRNRPQSEGMMAFDETFRS